MKILMITECFPFPPTDGVKIKVYHMLKGLSKRHDIHLLSFIESGQDVEIEAVRPFCRRIELIQKRPRRLTLLKAILNLFEKRPFSLKPFDSREMRDRLECLVRRESFDIVHLDMPNTAQFSDIVTGLPTFMAPHDSITLNLRRRVRLEKDPLRKGYQYIQWKKWQRYESEQYAKFNKCFVVSDVDRDVLMSLNPEMDIAVAPNGVDVDFFSPMALKPDDPSLVFSGSMESFQSVDAILHFYREIYPKIKSDTPGIRLYVVGKNPPSSVRRLAQDESVVVTGFVEDIRPYIDKSTVYICPIRSGSGIKNRLLEAMAMRKPIVAFAKSCEALKNVSHMDNIWLAKTPDEFADGVTRLLKDEGLRESMSHNARQLVVREYSWEKTINIIEEAYGDAIRKKTGNGKPARVAGLN